MDGQEGASRPVGLGPGLGSAQTRHQRSGSRAVADSSAGASSVSYYLSLPAFPLPSDKAEAKLRASCCKPGTVP